MASSKFARFICFTLLALCSILVVVSATVSPQLRSIAEHVPRYEYPLPKQPSPSPPSVSAPSTMADDCQLRALTLEFLSYLATDDTTGDWKGSAYSALQLSRCNASQAELEAAFAPAALTAREQLDQLYPRRDTHPLPPSPSATPAADCEWEVFVDSGLGSDENLGSIDAPVSSLHRALSLSRAVPRTPSAHPSSAALLRAAANAACITVRAGVYYLGANASASNVAIDSRVGAIALTAADSGLTIRAFPNETVVFSGGVPLTLNWTKSHAAVLRASLPDLPAFDRWHFNELYTDGRRAVTAKYPNGDPATHGLWNKQGWITSAKGWGPDKRFPAVARGPRLHAHAAQHALPPVPDGHRRSLRCPSPLSSPSGRSEGPSLVEAGRRTAYRRRCRGTPTSWAEGRRTGRIRPRGRCSPSTSGHWGSWAFDISGVDVASSTIHFGRGGHQEARGSEGGAEWYVANILEELDDGGEFFIDYAAQALYFQPNGSVPSTFVASQLPCILSIQGSQANPVDNVIVSGITFTHSSNTFMRDYEVPSGGDWSVHRGGAVFVEGTRFTSLSQNTFTGLGGNAVTLSNFNEGAGVMWNEFVWLGRVRRGHPGLGGRHRRRVQHRRAHLHQRHRQPHPRGGHVHQADRRRRAVPLVGVVHRSERHIQRPARRRQHQRRTLRRHTHRRQRHVQHSQGNQRPRAHQRRHKLTNTHTHTHTSWRCLPPPVSALPPPTVPSALGCVCALSRGTASRTWWTGEPGPR